MSTKDYIEFVTMQIVTYLDLPAEEKKQRRQTNEPLIQPIFIIGLVFYHLRFASCFINTKTRQGNLACLSDVRR